MAALSCKYSLARSLHPLQRRRQDVSEDKSRRSQACRSVPVAKVLERPGSWQRDPQSTSFDSLQTRRAFLANTAATISILSPWNADALQEDPIPQTIPDEDEDLAAAVFQAASRSVVGVTNVEVDRGGREKFEGTGSGFVWDQFGHIVTNYHVVAKAAKDTSGRQQNRVSVLLADGQYATVPAAVIGTDPMHDLAVLKLFPDDSSSSTVLSALVPIPLGVSASLQVGQSCFAIGNPYGLEHTLTAGVGGFRRQGPHFQQLVSGLNRDIPSPSGSFIPGAIQTDASINSGNSGGPLLDSRGRAIGVNTATFTRSGTGRSSGVNFAVPIDTVVAVVPSMIVYGYPRSSNGKI